MSKDHLAPHRSQARGGPLRGGRSHTTPGGGLLLEARGLLFDNDGVLVDSEPSVVRSWSRWAVDSGLDPAEVLAAVPGRRAADTVAVFVKPEDVARSTELITRYELEDVAGTVAVPGVRDLVAQLGDVPWAVVTSGVRELATARLRAAGVPVPEVVVTAEDVVEGKPHPEPYLTGAGRLGVPPGDLIVLEDSPSGVSAGLAAGATVLGIGRTALDSDAPAVVRDLTGARWTPGGLLLPDAALLRRP
ncbi:HAD-IA family hydrolase [Modestobacter marinus]|uniref:Sugar-phosphatase n=1 Tax=Modestobacter marinus TaxID=477641 RepID=A0A846M2B0_9ACTN|nr:HAD-IA family hydrolase [Modestobacter marinus]NIH69779.1 sugar-phosphatase [Modestobacter marinus]